ncbi:Hypothetical protein HVIM_03982 [Roseomonas mucosa]|uniref:Uncharacterized protein n=1 Tax=Roseomonas mucosa TaxID=207340 RepID=A0A4Y1MSS5_9PROT|nr:Hypothetical protein RADP37_03982 [Roseomonas mucosa]QDD93209.1 Hypothetical protein HVIM_03982 [Roseomonas mucosa]UZO90506.1 Hypothetical protein RMP42_03982 [Roseomonas mucosa]
MRGKAFRRSRRVGGNSARGAPGGEALPLAPAPSPPGTEAGPRTPGFRGFRWLPLVFGLIPGNRWKRGTPGKKRNTVSVLVAPAACRRAMLSGAIRHLWAPTHRVQGAQHPGG